MRYLFDHWPEIAEQLRTAGTAALFLDFDGTLAPVRAHPDAAALNDSTRRAITRLARNRRVHICVISGRLLADVRRRTSVPQIRYLGLHGWDGYRRAPLDPETRRIVERARQEVASQVAPVPGVWVEDKGPVFAVHYREAANGDVGLARAVVFDTMGPLSSDFHVVANKYAWEVLPRSIGDKGTAVLRELNLFGRPHLAFYLGDDTTDEPAFAALQHGITIRVGRRALTRAKFQLRDTAEVRTFLEKLEVELS
jgi:trehalose 6-phosphate phosphatase